MWTRKSILSNAIADWHTRGLIDEKTTRALMQDTDSADAGGFSFQNILILLAVICLGFAAMTFVAANWDDMTRLLRVGVVLGAMWAFWVGSALFTWRGNTWFAQVFTLGGCAMFGAGIMLISQIYHIQGSPKDATWLWAIGTLIAAALTRSIPALALSIVLFGVWSWLEPSMFSWRDPQLQFGILAYLAICSGLAYWMQSRFCAHLIVLTTVLWAVPSAMAMLDKKHFIFPAILVGAGYITLSGMLYSDRAGRWLRGFERATIFYVAGALGFLLFCWSIFTEETVGIASNDAAITTVIATGVVALAINSTFAVLARKNAHPNSYDLIVSAIFTALSFVALFFSDDMQLVFMALLLAATIWIIRMGWRIEFRPIAVLGFIGFGLIMLWIYFETIGSLLGTSVFYAVAGALLLAGVFIIPRLTRTTPKGDTQ